MRREDLPIYKEPTWKELRYWLAFPNWLAPFVILPLAILAIYLELSHRGYF